MTLDHTLIGELKPLDTLGILHRYDHLIHAIMTPGVIDNLPNYQTRARILFYGRLTGKNPFVRDSALRKNMRPNPIFFRWTPDSASARSLLVIHFFNVTGVTIFLALQISVKYMMFKMFKMSKTSYNPLQTVG